jgi:uncharacterized protein YlzI (FlbEa/FlbD family)
MNDKYDGVLKELAALLVPHLIAHPDVQAMLSASSQLVTRESVEEIVQAKLDGLGPVDKATIREVCEEVIDASDMDDRIKEVIDAFDIDDKINDWMTCSFDISDYQSEIVDMVEDRIDDQVETYLQSHLEGQIESHVRNLTFTVEVS